MKVHEIKNTFLRRAMICGCVVVLITISAIYVVELAVRDAIDGGLYEYRRQRDEFDDLLADIEKVW